MNHTPHPASSYNDISNKISHLVDLSNEWMSTVVIPNGIDHLDISSAAMGAESTTPVGATKQPYEYPRWGSSSSVFRFDPDIYGENSWPQLRSMLTKVGCVSGCRLVVSQSRVSRSYQRKITYELCCTHGILMSNKGASVFMDDNIGPSNVKTERIKRVKTTGAIRGNANVCVFQSERFALLLLTGTYEFDGTNSHLPIVSYQFVSLRLFVME